MAFKRVGLVLPTTQDISHLLFDFLFLNKEKANALYQNVISHANFAVPNF